MAYKDVLKHIKPSKREKEQMKRFTNKLIRKIKKMTNEARPMVCGSVSKDTWISKNKEIDLFLLYPTHLSKKELEKGGLVLAKKIVKEFKGKYEIAFSEHPYLKAQIKKFEVDIVPAYAVKSAEKIISSVDRTPFHVKFVQKKLKKPDDVRLLKQFCIANRCYGADAKRQGFSGYLCELLIIKYKDFKGCVKAVSRWKAGKMISFIQVDKKAILRKYKTPLIVLDPVDKNRNAGAAVSVESFYRFVKACKDFVKKPSEKFFLPKKTKPYPQSALSKKIKSRGTGWYLLKFNRPKVLEDTLYSQMRRCIKTMDRLLSQDGFRVLRSTFYCNKNCFIVYEMGISNIAKITKHRGPNVYSKHAENFLKHYKKQKTFIENEIWVVELEREFTDVFQFFKKMLRTSEKELLKKGIPNKVAPNIRKGKLYDGKNFLKGMKNSSNDFKSFFREWFEEDLY